MAKTRQALGRGLSALIPTTPDLQAAAGPATVTPTELDVDRLQPNSDQPRTTMDETRLDELSRSIEVSGVIQPIVVRHLDDGRFEIVAGERRWRAAQRAGLHRVPVVVRDVADENLLQLALVENLQRENLNPIEEAAGIQRLLDEFGLTHQQAAEAVGRSRVAVSNLLRLLKLDPSVREHLESGRIEAGHARALLGLPKGQQVVAAQAVMQRRLSVRQAEELVRRMLEPSGKTASKKPKNKKGRSRDIQRLEEALSEKLAAPVHLESRDGKSGRLVIEYSSLDELDGIIERLD